MRIILIKLYGFDQDTIWFIFFDGHLRSSQPVESLHIHECNLIKFNFFCLCRHGLLHVYNETLNVGLGSFFYCAWLRVKVRLFDHLAVLPKVVFYLCSLASLKWDLKRFLTDSDVFVVPIDDAARNSWSMQLIWIFYSCAHRSESTRWGHCVWKI